jgi:hypothetical protein
MWVSCQQTSQCCGKAQCLMSADGWQHCNLPSNLLTTKPAMAPTAAPTPAPTVKVPTKPPTRRSDPSACQSAHRILPTVAPAPTAAPAPAPINPVTKSPTTTPTPAPYQLKSCHRTYEFGAYRASGRNNWSKQQLGTHYLASPTLAPPNFSEQKGCPHKEVGLVDWASLFSVSTGQAISIPPNSRVLIQSVNSYQVGCDRYSTYVRTTIGENTDGITLDTEGISVRGTDCWLRDLSYCIQSDHHVTLVAVRTTRVTNILTKLQGYLSHWRFISSR